jgi:hypothetical protein
MTDTTVKGAAQQPAGPAPTEPVTGSTPPAVAVRSRRQRGIDRSALNPETMKPDRHYHWFRRDSESLSDMRSKGYTLENVNDKDSARPITDFEKTPEGHIVQGDIILASCPTSLFEEGRRELHKYQEELLNSTTAETEEQARAKGVSIIRDKE